MMKHNNYFVRYVPTEKKVDYCLLFSLYDIAEYNEADNVYNIIHYDTQDKLAAKLNVSRNIVKKIFSQEEYQNFLQIDQKQKIIKLSNVFLRGTKEKFVVLTAQEVEEIRRQNTRKFERYLIFAKFTCGRTANKADFTAKQFLNTFNYSVLQDSDCSKYNKILVSCGFVRITTQRDEQQHIRNIYSWVSL